MSAVVFNRRPYRYAGGIDQPPQDLVKATPSLWQADLDTAALFGGELTRDALGAMNIRGDKKYVVVDTKVHMLMPGQCPAIPGWHTDGAPRNLSGGSDRRRDYSPLGSGPPDLSVQEEWDEAGDIPRFHLLVTGEGCLTEFLDEPAVLEAVAAPNLYAEITRQVEAGDFLRSFVPSCAVVEWDWWNLHQGIYATRREFRFLIRVTGCPTLREFARLRSPADTRRARRRRHRIRIAGIAAAHSRRRRRDERHGERHRQTLR